MTRVTLIGTTDCRLCDAALALLDRLGAECPLSVEKIDLASVDGERLAAEHGMVFPPGVLLDGLPFSYGRLSERRLRRALARTRTRV